MAATSAEDFLRAPAIDATGRTNAQMNQLLGHPVTDNELCSDPTSKVLWVRQDGQWQAVPVGLPQAGDGIVPTGYKGSTIDRRNSGTGGAIGASGTLFLFAAFIPKGVEVSVLAMLFSTAVVTPTNTWMSLWNSDRDKLAVTNDLTTTVPAAGGVQAFTLTAPFETTYRGLHFFGITQVAATVATARGTNPSNALSAPPALAGSSSSTGLTDPASAPATAGAITPGSVLPLGYWG